MGQENLLRLLDARGDQLFYNPNLVIAILAEFKDKAFTVFTVGDTPSGFILRYPTEADARRCYTMAVNDWNRLLGGHNTN